MKLKQMFRTVLVIGDNPEEIIKKYSLNTTVEPYLYLQKDKADIYKSNKIKLLEETLKLDFLSSEQKELIKEEIELVNDMSDLEFYLTITEGCTYDKKNGDAYSTKNPHAFYCNERSPQYVFEKTGERTGFCNPFNLYDNYQSYSAIKEEIDWKLNHLYNQEVYKAAWELVVEDRKPQTEQEKHIKDNMKNRKGYFQNFKDKEEYILYSTAFWTYGIATENFYKEVGMNGINDKQWVSGFYDNFIKNLPDDELLTIYEVQGIN